MRATPAAGAILGLVFAFGFVLSVRRLPFMRRPSLDQRLAPYLVDRRDAVRRIAVSERTITPFPTLERLVQPYLSRCGELLERFVGGTVSVRKRLDQAGTDLTVSEFRVEQVVWAVAAFGVAVLLSIILLLQGFAQSPIAVLLFSVAAGVVGMLGRDHVLSRHVRDREARILAEFPTVADLLALSVSAGEGPVGALERVARTSSGELARELNRGLVEARTGATLIQALQGIADRTSLTPLARFVDGMSVAIERGTPLADVLRAQAMDVREAGKRALLEAGSKREIAMMVPVVFMVMPITILFALFPGFITLSQTVP